MWFTGRRMDGWWMGGAALLATLILTWGVMWLAQGYADIWDILLYCNYDRD